jgi:putative sterol carrier protein
MNIFLVQCCYGNGRVFEHDINTKAFKNEKDAKSQVKKDLEDAKELFLDYYDMDSLRVTENEDGNYMAIDTDDYDDWWEGKVLKVELK